VSQLPDLPVNDLVIKNPWPPGWDVPGPYASRGKNLNYYRHTVGVIALDGRTGEEVWRLKTARDRRRSGLPHHEGD
jgi:hypothetical protein